MEETRRIRLSCVKSWPLSFFSEESNWQLKMWPQNLLIHNGSTSLLPSRSSFLSEPGIRGGVGYWCDVSRHLTGLRAAFHKGAGFEMDSGKGGLTGFRLYALDPLLQSSWRPFVLASCKQFSTSPSRLLTALLNRGFETFSDGFSHTWNG